MYSVRKQGSNYPSIVCAIPDHSEEEIANIISAQLEISGPDGVTLEDLVSVDGGFRYDFSPDDPVPEGVYRMRLYLRFPGAKLEVLPSQGDLRMLVER